MKKNLVYFSICAILISACSSPKYTYHFGTHSYQATNASTKETGNENNAIANTSNESVRVQEDAALVIASAPSTKIEAMIAEKTVSNQTESTFSSKKSEIKNSAVSKKEERKEAKTELKKAIKEYKNISKEAGVDGTKGAGKNQLVALLLAIFLGGLGIHRFYLGRIGSGIIQLLLAITSFLIVPGIVLLVWVIIDIIRIAIGTLKPKSGDYETTL